MNKNNNALILSIAFVICLMTLTGQTYAPPANLSPKDVAEWAIAGGFIASGNAKPTTTAGIATGALYIDTTDADSPKLWRFNGSAWTQLSGADSETVLAHLAAIQDPHGAQMGVSERVTIGDPDGVNYVDIDSPSPGLARIASYIQLLPLATAPDVLSGGIYYNSNGHFYGSDGASWTQLDN